MSSNYPEGSMNGSGIYAEDYSGTFYCSECDVEHELDGTTNDSQSYAYAFCPVCGKDLEVELPSRDDYEDDYYQDYREGK